MKLYLTKLNENESKIIKHASMHIYTSGSLISHCERRSWAFRKISRRAPSGVCI